MSMDPCVDFVTVPCASLSVPLNQTCASQNLSSSPLVLSPSSSLPTQVISPVDVFLPSQPSSRSLFAAAEVQKENDRKFAEQTLELENAAKVQKENDRKVAEQTIELENAAKVQKENDRKFAEQTLELENTTKVFLQLKGLLCELPIVLFLHLCSTLQSNGLSFKLVCETLIIKLV